MNNWIKVLNNHVILVGLAVRILLAWLLPYLLDDGRLIPGVAYTDIDYHIFSDAAKHFLDGGSPYDRHTYRYTPFLAVIMAYSHGYGRYIFCVADALCGWLVIRLRNDARKKMEPSQQDCQVTKFHDALYWMYNPLAINICTRGSAESLMVLLPVLMTVSVLQMKGKLPMWTRAVLAGLIHGVAVHSKLYPIIYSLSFMAHFGNAGSPRVVSKNPLILMKSWFWRLLRPGSILFFVAFVCSFFCLTYLGVLLFGRQALDEGLLYHFSRVDHRHNYSIFWYGIYLGRFQTVSSTTDVIGLVFLLPQAILLVFSSLGIAPHDLSLALFCQTYLFVTLNKVITAQYFTWYLCLLPLCSHSFLLTRRVQHAIVALIASILCWLGCAFCLEMQGLSIHGLVWLASLVYFLANVNLLCSLLQSYSARADHNSVDFKLD